MKLFLIFLIVFFKMKPAETPLYKDFWVIWNIGQGQWVTHLLPDKCIHYDMGGEAGTFSSVRSKLIKNCGSKINFLILSHWDYDHYFNITFAAKTLPNLCWLYRPQFGASKSSVQKVIDLNIPRCKPVPVINWVPSSANSTNESSAVFFDSGVLLPGDSPSTQEKTWAVGWPAIQKTKVLVLGHHGSQSSTGMILLDSLAELKWAAASARWVKYHHPHFKTLKRIYSKDIPVLRTEDWGNIWFQSFN